MSLDSPNLIDLERWATEARRVDKPWGWELVWAETDQYVGKVLFVKAGESLSLQFHRVKDESWYVYAGRAKIELGDAGEAALKEEVVAAPAFFRFRAGNRPSRERARGHDDHRGVHAAARRRRPARGSLRP